MRVKGNETFYRQLQVNRSHLLPPFLEAKWAVFSANMFMYALCDPEILFLGDIAQRNSQVPRDLCQYVYTSIVSANNCVTPI